MPPELTSDDIRLEITELCNQQEYEKAKKVYEERNIKLGTNKRDFDYRLSLSLSKAEFYIVTGKKKKGSQK